MESQGNIVVVIVSKDRTEKYQLKMSTGTDTGNMLVLVSLIDVDADGHKDLVLRVDGTDISTVLYNNGSGFQPTPPAKG
jgi:hypothetical protein